MITIDAYDHVEALRTFATRTDLTEAERRLCLDLAERIETGDGYRVRPFQGSSPVTWRNSHAVLWIPSRKGEVHMNPNLAGPGILVGVEI